MKKSYYLFIFLAIFSGLLFLARADLIDQYDYFQVKKAPAQTTATNREYSTAGKGGFQDHYATFFYEVDGKKYDFKSLNTTKKIATAYVNKDQYKQITYAKHAPSSAMLTYHFDLWQKKKNDSMVYIIVGSIAIASLLLTLLIALVIFLRNRKRNEGKQQ